MEESGSYVDQQRCLLCLKPAKEEEDGYPLHMFCDKDCQGRLFELIRDYGLNYDQLMLSHGGGGGGGHGGGGGGGGHGGGGHGGGGGHFGGGGRGGGHYHGGGIHRGGGGGGRYHHGGGGGARYRGGYHSGRFYARGHGFWGLGFGYGFGAWYMWRYPYLYGYFAPWYALWYPPLWVPSYVVNEQAALAYDDGGGQVALPRQSYQSNYNEFGVDPASLPVLPNFASRGINVNALRYSNERPNPEQEAQIRATITQIDSTLQEIKSEPQIQQAMSRGYIPVPDMDRQRFSWVRQK